MSEWILNYPSISAVFITGQGTYIIVPTGINSYLVEIYGKLPTESYTVSSGTQTVLTIVEQETYTIP